MKLLLALFVTLSTLYSNVYYSKVEPYEIKKISSNVVGLVLFTNENMLGEKLTHNPYIKIDAQLDRDELKYIDEKLQYSKSTIVLNESMLENLKISLKKKRENYKKVQALKIKSSIEKDREFYDLVATENSFLATQKEINSLKIQVSDLELRKIQLQRSISDKSLIAQGYTLYELNVKVGQVVNKGTLLATVLDTSRAILTIYLNKDDVVAAKSKIVYIDGKKTTYKISRVLNIADSKNISKYMAQIVVESPQVFSKLVKIELK